VRIARFQFRSCPRNCERRARAWNHWDDPREGGRRAATRKPGDLPSEDQSDRLAGVPGKEPNLDHDGILPAGPACGGTASGDDRPCGDVTIVVCATCRDESGSDAHPRAGALLAQDTMRAAAGESVRVRTVECLGNCKRRLSASLLRDGCWSYVFGDLTPDSGADLVTGARLFSTSTDGLLPWRGRPDSLKRGLVARIPPLLALKDQP
jgi:predicted metal-binding protein